MNIAKNIAKAELIGEDVVVIIKDQQHKCKVIDETKNTITVEEKDKILKFFKGQIKLQVRGYEIEGKLIIGRPEDRIKSKIK